MSNVQENVEASLAVNCTEMAVALVIVGNEPELVMVTVGGIVSTTQLSVGGAASDSPAELVADTLNVWAPLLKPE